MPDSINLLSLTDLRILLTYLRLASVSICGRQRVTNFDNFRKKLIEEIKSRRDSIRDKIVMTSQTDGLKKKKIATYPWSHGRSSIMNFTRANVTKNNVRVPTINIQLVVARADILTLCRSRDVYILTSRRLYGELHRAQSVTEGPIKYSYAW